MTYFEYLCQLCGVSFNICRIRRADEPESAAWAYYGSGYIRSEGDADFDGCRDCELVEREDDLTPGVTEREHVAGPGCSCVRGYSGHRISLDEMKGCRAVQCLAGKDGAWVPEPDDQDFELESGFFLTGIGDGSPDTSPLDEIKPARHGVKSIDMDNIVC